MTPASPAMHPSGSRRRRVLFIKEQAITAIPFTGLIDADCRFTVYSRSSTNGPVRSYISNFVLEVKLLLFQSWPPSTSARRLLVLRHGPSARLQGVAIFTGYAPVFKGLPSLLAMSRLFNALPTADAILVSTSADAILVSAVPRSSGV